MGVIPESPNRAAQLQRSVPSLQLGLQAKLSRHCSRLSALQQQAKNKVLKTRQNAANRGICLRGGMYLPSTGKRRTRNRFPKIRTFSLQKKAASGVATQTAAKSSNSVKPNK